MPTDIPNEKHQLAISPASIFFAALIGIGFLIMFSVLGIAIGTSFLPDKSSFPSGGILILGAAVGVGVLTSAFFIAGYIASRISHELLLFDSLIHSMSAWAIMALFLMVVLSFGAFAEKAQYNFKNMKMPAILTDVHLFKGTAVTTVQSAPKKEKPTVEENQRQDAMAIIWWIYFASLVCGLGTSVFGGLLGNARHKG